MKVTKEEKAIHREQIIATAAHRFREKGFDGISVSDLMKEVGLTHGGFYGHFSSKDELVALAVQRAFRETIVRWEKVIEAAPERPLEAFMEYYLTTRHRLQPQSGCILAALGSDLSRQPEMVKAVVTEGQQKALETIAKAIPGPVGPAKRRQAIAILARLVGAMILSRSVVDKEFSAEILEASAESTEQEFCR
jgi:TetR/AcrR family transcriptional regulator, transcriptional repressor for nem operon